MQYIEFSEIGTTFAVIAAAFAFVVLVWNGIKAIHDWRLMVGKPTADKLEDHEERIKVLETCCADVHGKLNADWQWQQDAMEFNELMLLSVKQLLKHGVDNNDIDGMSKMENEIDKYLLKQKKGRAQ